MREVAPTAPAEPSAPDGYQTTSWGTSQTIEYKFYFGKNYEDGIAQCAADGPYKMPVINNPDENDQIASIMATRTPIVRTIWLGINDVDNEGTWVDQNGNIVSYTNFQFTINNSSKNYARLLQDLQHLSHNWNGEWKYEVGTATGPVLCMRII